LVKKIQDQNEKPWDFYPVGCKGSSTGSQSPEREAPGNINISAKNQPGDIFLELVYPNGILLRLRKDIDIRLLKELIQLCD
jgi:hypothetical protein